MYNLFCVLDSDSGDEPLISKARKKTNQNGSIPGSNSKTARNMRSCRSMPESYNGCDSNQDFILIFHL